jgi:hypothetical protein
MEESTTLTKKDADQPESQKMGVTVRGWITFLLVFTICASHMCVVVSVLVNAARTQDLNLVGSLTTIGEPLYSMAVAALGYYFGSQKMKGMMGSSTTTTTTK